MSAMPNRLYIEIDLSRTIGYLMLLQIQKSSSNTPLAWQSWSQGNLLNTGELLEGPGLLLFTGELGFKKGNSHGRTQVAGRLSYFIKSRAGARAC